MKMRATRAHTARAMSLFAFLVLSTTRAWSAPGVDPDESTEYLVHAMGNVEQLEAVFQGIVHIIDSPAFKTAVLLTMTIALVMQGFAGQFTNSKLTLADLIGDRVKNLIVPMVLTTALFAGPRATVTIVDPYWGHSSGLLVQIVAPRKVDNVPIGFAMFANFFSVTRTHLQAAFDEAFAQPDDLRYSKTGMLFGNKVMTNLASIQVSNPNLRADLIAYMRNCYFYDVYQGRVQPDAVLAPDIWRGMTRGVTVTLSSSGRKTFAYGDNIVTNPNRLTQVIYDDIHRRPPGPPDQLYPGQRETYETMGCTDAVPLITQKMSKMAQYEEESWVRRLMRGTITSGTTDSGKAAFATAVGGILPNFMGSNSNYAVADHIRQAAMTNLVKESGGDLGTILANPAIVQQATAQAQSEVAVKANYVQTARLAEMALPLIRNGLEAIAYGCFPIVILVALAYGANGAMPVLKGYLIGLGTLQIWGPLYSIVNMLGTDFSKRKLFNMLGGQPSFTLENMSMISNEMSSDMAVMGYMVLLVPVIAGMLVKAGMDGVSGMASQMMSPATGTAASGMAQNAALGNYSWDNLSQGNTTAHNFSGFNTTFNNTLANKYNPETVLAGSSKDVSLQDREGVTTFRGNKITHKEDMNVGPQELTITSVDAMQAAKQSATAHKLVEQTAKTKTDSFAHKEAAADDWAAQIATGYKAARNTYGDNWADHVYFKDKSGKTVSLGSTEWYKTRENKDALEQKLLNANRDGTDALNSPSFRKNKDKEMGYLLAEAALIATSDIPKFGYSVKAAGTTANILFHEGDRDIMKRQMPTLTFGDASTSGTANGAKNNKNLSNAETIDGGIKESAGDRVGQRNDFSRINEDIATKRSSYQIADENVQKAELNHNKAVAAERSASESAAHLKSVTATGAYKPLANNNETQDLATSQAYDSVHTESNGATMQEKRDWLSKNESGVAQTLYAKALSDFNAASSQEKIQQMRNFLLKEKQNSELQAIENSDKSISQSIKTISNPQNAQELVSEFNSDPTTTQVNDNLDKNKTKVQNRVEASTSNAAFEIVEAKNQASENEKSLFDRTRNVKNDATTQFQVAKAGAKKPGSNLGRTWEETENIVNQNVGGPNPMRATDAYNQIANGGANSPNGGKHANTRPESPASEPTSNQPVFFEPLSSGVLPGEVNTDPKKNAQKSESTRFDEDQAELRSLYKYKIIPDPDGGAPQYFNVNKTPGELINDVNKADLLLQHRTHNEILQANGKPPVSLENFQGMDKKTTFKKD